MKTPASHSDDSEIPPCIFCGLLGDHPETCPRHRTRFALTNVVAVAVLAAESVPCAGCWNCDPFIGKAALYEGMGYRYSVPAADHLFGPYIEKLMIPVPCNGPMQAVQLTAGRNQCAWCKRRQGKHTAYCGLDFGAAAMHDFERPGAREGLW